MRPYYAGVAQPGRATYQVLPVMETNSNVLWLLTRGSWVRTPPVQQILGYLKSRDDLEF